MVKCIKYSFNNRLSHSCNLYINEKYVSYFKDMNILNRIIQLNDVNEVTYGPRTKIFKKLKKYMPHLIISFILKDRSYDFEFKKIDDIKTIINEINKNNIKYNFNIKIPSHSEINRDYKVLSNRLYDKKQLYDPSKINIDMLTLPDLNSIVSQLNPNELYEEESPKYTVMS